MLMPRPAAANEDKVRSFRATRATHKRVKVQQRAYVSGLPIGAPSAGHGDRAAALKVVPLEKPRRRG